MGMGDISGWRDGLSIDHPSADEIQMAIDFSNIQPANRVFRFSNDEKVYVRDKKACGSNIVAPAPKIVSINYEREKISEKQNPNYPNDRNISPDIYVRM